MIIISDIHGCYNTLRRLLRRCPDEEVVFCGDLVDRGPDSAAVVKFAMEEKIPTVMGNHEDLMLHYHGRKSAGYDSKDLWLWNGGDLALQSFRGVIPDDVLDWVEGLPMEIVYGDLLISHTGIGNSDSRMESLWARDVEFKDDGKFRVFGHTPSRFTVMAPNWARIDTGAAYLKNGFGNLTAFQWPSCRLITERFDESQVN